MFTHTELLENAGTQPFFVLSKQAAKGSAVLTGRPFLVQTLRRNGCSPQWGVQQYVSEEL